MLRLSVPEREYYDESKNLFLHIKPQVVIMEHSLMSVAKWESKWKVSFLNSLEKQSITTEQLIDYFRCMTINANTVDPNCYYGFTEEMFKRVTDYMNDTMTATTFNNHKEGAARGNRSIVTAEIIYYDMIAYNIPFECEKWHLNRLLTLINVCRIKNEKPKKMKKSEIMSRNRALNARRKAHYHTNG